MNKYNTYLRRMNVLNKTIYNKSKIEKFLRVELNKINMIKDKIALSPKKIISYFNFKIFLRRINKMYLFLMASSTFLYLSDKKLNFKYSETFLFKNLLAIICPVNKLEYISSILLSFCCIRPLERILGSKCLLKYFLICYIFTILSNIAESIFIKPDSTLNVNENFFNFYGLALIKYTSLKAKYLGIVLFFTFIVYLFKNGQNFEYDVRTMLFVSIFNLQGKKFFNPIKSKKVYAY